MAKTKGFVINAGSGSGILRLAPENSTALEEKSLKTVCSNSRI
jgi:hypothetical protein